jgi:hypothetical protein
MSLLVDLAWEVGLSDGPVFIAVALTCNKTGASSCSTSEIRNIFEEEKELLAKTRHGSYNILSFGDRLTKVTKRLSGAGFFVETKIKGKLHYSLTQKAIDLISKICTKEKISLLLTSSLSYERNFGAFGEKLTRLPEKKTVEG